MQVVDSYREFVERKIISHPESGIEVACVNPKLFEFQRDIVKWALRKGRAAIFADCGLGKTPMQLSWAEQVPGNVLILAPLAVGRQTVREGQKFDIDVTYTRKHDGSLITSITNYEMLEHFDPAQFNGIVLDESSILKSFDGKLRNEIIAGFQQTPYRLACTATPAPNDFMELGNHAEFLGTLTRTEMLSTFFVHDGGDTAKWRLKKHAERDFWKWVCSWAVMIRKPSDLGYSDEGFILPPIKIHNLTVEASQPSEGLLFALPANTLEERRKARQVSVGDRVEISERIIRESWIKSKSESTTEPIELLIGTESSNEERSGTPQTLIENGSEAESTDLPTVTESSPLKRSTSQPISKSDAPICESVTSSSAKNLSQRIESGEVTRQRAASNAIGISEKNSESACFNTNQSSNPKMADAQSVAINSVKAENSPSITVTTQGLSEESCARHVTARLGNSEIIQDYSAEQRNISKTQWVVWCGLNREQDALAKALGDDCVSVYGSLTPEEKTARYERFARGEVAVLISKASIFGFGLNMQFSNHQLFLGMSDSFESYYQAVRRQWRFGQKRAVNCYIVTSTAEGAVVDNIKRKEADANKMAEEMVNNMHELNQKEIRGLTGQSNEAPEVKCEKGKHFSMYRGDCVQVVSSLPSDSVHYSIFSPPFASLYTYSASPYDMGNCRTHSEFYDHFKFLAKELHRVTMPGRNLSFHCMNLPVSKERNGFIGIADFRGDLIRIFQDAGFIYHSEVCIWKDPVTAMQRTKALGLLHKQLKKDSCMSRQGIADYLVTMRKHGDNPERVSHTAESFPVSIWQRYASPVWMDIDASDTLQRESAREDDDERHICPLQLEVIRRGVELWSNPGDTVLSPFGGIGSEGYVSIQKGRKFVGVELKESYWKQAVANLKSATIEQTGLFSEVEA